MKKALIALVSVTGIIAVAVSGLFVWERQSKRALKSQIDDYLDDRGVESTRGQRPRPPLHPLRPAGFRGSQRCRPRVELRHMHEQMQIAEVGFPPRRSCPAIRSYSGHR